MSSLMRLDDTSLHGNVIYKLDVLKTAITDAASRFKDGIKLNRVYMQGEVVAVNVTVGKQKFAITVLPSDTIELSFLDKKVNMVRKRKLDCLIFHG